MRNWLALAHADVRLPLVAQDTRAPRANGLTNGLTCSPADKVNARADALLAKAIATGGEKFATPGTAELGPLLRRIGDARIVLIGESTQGTAEFYRMRDRISRDLIERKGFSFVAIDGDWAAAARIDRHVRGLQTDSAGQTADAVASTWVGRHREMRSFVDWLHGHNKRTARPVAFHGLDPYGLHASIRAALPYPEGGPMPTDTLHPRLPFGTCDGTCHFDVPQIARSFATAEHDDRAICHGSRAAWNLRAGHLFDTLKRLLELHGPRSKGIVWAHNVHIGDSSATEMARHGVFNLGHLCRRQFGRGVYTIGLGTNSGTVAAASDWCAPMETKTVRPGLAGSYEKLFHQAGAARFLLPLAAAPSAELARGLASPRLERAIGAVYRPEAGHEGHYQEAVLARQFDEYIWFDETHAITPLAPPPLEGRRESDPFDL